MNDLETTTSDEHKKLSWGKKLFITSALATSIFGTQLFTPMINLYNDLFHGGKDSTITHILKNNQGTFGCSHRPSDPEPEKVENIQNFNATSSAGGNVSGTHHYSSNGTSGPLGNPVSAGFTTKDRPINSDITITGNGIIPRTYRGVNIYGTQNRNDSMSANGRVDVNEWVRFIGDINTTWGHPSITIEFYDDDIPEAFKQAVIASFMEYASNDNKLLKPENITWRDAGPWPGSYTAKKGVIQIKTDPQASGMGNISSQIDGVTCAGALAPNPCFDTGVYGMLNGERNDLLQGPSNVDGNLMGLSALIHGANMHAEGRKNYMLVIENGVPKEYQSDFSGSISQSATVYSTLQRMPGQGSLLGWTDIPDDDKMVVGRRYGETPKMDDIMRRQGDQRNHNPELSYKNQERKK